MDSKTLMNTPNRKQRNLSSAIFAAMLYLGLCTVVYLVASVMASNSEDANIGAGFLAFLPALPWPFFALGSSSHLGIYLGYAINASVVGITTFFITNPRDN